MVCLEFIGRSKPFVNRMLRGLLLVIFSIGLLSCGDLKQEASHQRGEMKIYADPSTKSLLEALTQIYTMKYPEVKFDIVYN